MSELTVPEIVRLIDQTFVSVDQADDVIARLRAVNPRKRPEVRTALEGMFMVRAALQVEAEKRKYGGRLVHRALYDTPEKKQARRQELGGRHDRMERRFLNKLVRAFQEQQNAALRALRRLGGEP